MNKKINSMKKITAIILSGVMLIASSCSKQLDINANPNSATSATPELILPQALNYTAGLLNSFNTYGAQVGGYAANAGGYGGFGTAFTYNFASGDYGGLFTSSYDLLEDYQSIINQSQGVATNNYFNAIGKIMKSLHFQLLVDTYNDVPYSQALQGASVLSPRYDAAADIYKDLAIQLDSAITLINAGSSVVGIKTPSATQDGLFGGNMTKWKQLANTVKLRILVRGNGKVTFANSTFSSDGFLTTDALINPGYTRDNGKQNPKWNTWGWSYTGAAGNKAWMPTTFAKAFYDGVKLVDYGRGRALYYNFPSTSTNQLGQETNSTVTIAPSPEGSFWYPSSSRVGTSAGNATGALKGPNAGMPLITAAESYFLQAEGVLKGIVTGTAATLYNNGITASFRYLYALPDGTFGTLVPATDAATYLTDNASSPLVNFSLATTPAQQLEAIITQKWIALNFVNSDQAWNDYRRTGYPTLVNTPGASATQTFASKYSESTRPDHLPTRILYPPSEGAYNSANVPKGISPFTSLIFWAQ
ncbi:MAG: hypothetical protein RL377_707 [Bacteroidota bacterium]|jgi:hypothetical protein